MPSRRSAVLALALALVGACAHPRPPEPAPPILTENFSAQLDQHLAGLRAQLDRANIAVELDTGGVVETAGCLVHADCARCTVARTGELRDDVAFAVLDAFATGFARYPTRVLAASGFDRVVLCRRIDSTATAVAEPAGVADLVGRRMLVSFARYAEDRPAIAMDAEAVVHHELFHLLERARWPELAAADLEWSLANPTDFRYGARDRRELGFVSGYAMTNAMEDRASVFEYLMGDPDGLCAIAVADPLVRAKVARLWRRVAEVAGDGFLRARAPCVDWI